MAYLAPGYYRLTVEAAGFKTHVQDGIYVSAAETPRIDVGLEVGSLSENVTVTAVAPLFRPRRLRRAQHFKARRYCGSQCKPSSRCVPCTFFRIRSAIASWDSARASYRGRISHLQPVHHHAPQWDLHPDSIRGKYRPEKSLRSRHHEFSVTQSVEGA